MNWLIKILGGVTQQEHTNEKIHHLRCMAEVIDQHKERLDTLKSLNTDLQIQLYKMLIKEPKA